MKESVKLILFLVNLIANRSAITILNQLKKLELWPVAGAFNGREHDCVPTAHPALVKMSRGLTMQRCDGQNKFLTLHTCTLQPHTVTLRSLQPLPWYSV